MTGGRSTPRDRAIEDHLPLVRCLARRFARRGEEMDDLVQVGAIGLINAVDRFQPSRGVSLTSYAVPCIVGEMQRHLRDRTQVVRIPRRVQQDSGWLRGAGSDWADRSAADDPVQAFLADVWHARVAVTVDESEVATNRVAVGVALRGLGHRDQALVKRRFFDDLNQDEIALEFGISQVQVSRLLRSCLNRLRVELDDRVVAVASQRA